MELPIDDSGDRARLALLRHPGRRPAVIAWPLAALLHGSALLAAAFVEIDAPVRARESAIDDEVVLMLDLRASSLYDIDASDEQLAGAPGDANETAPALETVPEASSVELAVAHGTEIGEEPPVESEVEPPPVEIVDAVPPESTWPEDEPLLEMPLPQVVAPEVAPEVASVAGAQPVEASAATTESTDENASAWSAVADASTAAVAAGTPTGELAPAGGGGTGGSAEAGSSDGNGGVGLGGDDVASLKGGDLRARFAPRPKYPEGARRRGEQGSVLCRLTIDRDGRVVDVSVVTSSTFADLDAAAVATLRRWRFEPIGRLTSASRARALQKLTFSLANARG